MPKSMELLIRRLRKQEIAPSFSLIKELRTHLTSRQFLTAVNKQKKIGYELVGAFLGKRMVGVLGMRPVITLARGPHLHVDDLIVASIDRKSGVGRSLLAFAEKDAVERGLQAIFL